VTAPIDVVVGTISDVEGDLVRYTLSYAPLNDPGTFKVAHEVTAPIGQTLTEVNDMMVGRFDPTILPNGPYIIRLEAEDQNHSISEDQRMVNVAGNLKLGKF